MADDLEKFLQQAARHLAEQRQQPVVPRPEKSSRTREIERVSRQHDDTEEEEPLQAQVVDDWRDPRSGPDPLSNLDTPPPRISQVDLADERMETHIHAAMHDQSPPPIPSKDQDSYEGHSESRGSTSVTRRNMQVSPLIAMLRDPQTLKAALISGEILRRKFDP